MTEFRVLGFHRCCPYFSSEGSPPKSDSRGAIVWYSGTLFFLMFPPLQEVFIQKKWRQPMMARNGQTRSPLEFSEDKKNHIRIPSEVQRPSIGRTATTFGLNRFFIMILLTTFGDFCQLEGGSTDSDPPACVHPHIPGTQFCLCPHLCPTPKPEGGGVFVSPVAQVGVGQGRGGYKPQAHR